MKSSAVEENPTPNSLGVLSGISEKYKVVTCEIDKGEDCSESGRCGGEWVGVLTPEIVKKNQKGSTYTLPSFLGGRSSPVSPLQDISPLHVNDKSLITNLPTKNNVKIELLDDDEGENKSQFFFLMNIVKRVCKNV